MKQAYVIRKVMVTEKGSLITGQNKYLLQVAPGANKIEIRQAVEAQFGVHVLSVNTQNYKGKTKYTRTRHLTKTPAWKRAIVTLKAGERIELI